MITKQDLQEFIRTKDIYTPTDAWRWYQYFAPLSQERQMAWYIYLDMRDGEDIGTSLQPVNNTNSVRLIDNEIRLLN